jgi:hypothetical protein
VDRGELALDVADVQPAEIDPIAPGARASSRAGEDRPARWQVVAAAGEDRHDVLGGDVAGEVTRPWVAGSIHWTPDHRDDRRPAPSRLSTPRKR